MPIKFTIEFEVKVDIKGAHSYLMKRIDFMFKFQYNEYVDALSGV